MPTTNTRYVDVDAEAGGDGTTNGLTGATCAYKSLSIWEAARDDVGDLVANDTVEQCICESSHANHTADTTLVVIDGWTTDATRYIEIKTSAAARHAGVYTTAKYRLTTATSTTLLQIGESYVRVEGLQLACTASGNYACWMYGNVGTCDIRLSSCVVETHAGSGFYDGGNGTKFSIWNCVFRDDAVGVYGIRFLNTGSSANRAYSCTLYGYDTGAINKYGTTTIKNCLFYDNAVDVSNGPATDTYCATSNDNTKGLSAAGTGNRFSQTFTFVGAPTNLALAATDAGAREYGTDTSGESAPLNFTTDIVGNTRS